MSANQQDSVAVLRDNWQAKARGLLARLETMQPPNVLLQQITMLGEARDILRDALQSQQVASSDRGEAVAWFTDDHLSDRSATTYDKVVAERWRTKGWPVTPLYATPPSPAESAEGWRKDAETLLRDILTVQPPDVLLQQLTQLGRARDILTAALATPASPSGVSDADMRAWLSDYRDILIDEGKSNEAKKVQAVLDQPQPGLVEGSLLRSPNEAPHGCHCKPGKCMAPVVMGRQTACLDPDKAAAPTAGDQESDHG